MSIPQYSPQQLRPCIVVLTDEESRRVHRLIVRLGSVEAARVVLNIGRDTLSAARHRGRMLVTTRDRVLAALDREEANHHE